jgi:hypothetical protein
MFTPELGREICGRIAAGASLRDIARCRDMPAIRTISEWVANNDSFYEDYTRARQQRAHVIADELLELILGLTKDIPAGQAAMPHVLARKYQLDHLRWYLSKILRHEYGDKLEVETTNRYNVVVSLPSLVEHDPETGQMRKRGCDAPAPTGRPSLNGQARVLEQLYGPTEHRQIEDQSDD